MDIAISQTKDNKLLNRSEIEGHISFDGATPSTAAITKALADHFKTAENLVVVKHVYNLFGQKKAEIEVSIYKDRPAFELVEIIKKKPKKKAEAKAEAPKK